MGLCRRAYSTSIERRRRPDHNIRLAPDPANMEVTFRPHHVTPGERGLGLPIHPAQNTDDSLIFAFRGAATIPATQVIEGVQKPAWLLGAVLLKIREVTSCEL